jgi:hypothetical protein
MGSQSVCWLAFLDSSKRRSERRLADTRGLCIGPVDGLSVEQTHAVMTPRREALRHPDPTREH